MMTSALPSDLRVGVTTFRAGIPLGTAQGAIDRMHDRMRRIEDALLMGLRLAESGGHGEGQSCPTCHFVQEARKALGAE